MGKSTSEGIELNEAYGPLVAARTRQLALALGSDA